MPKPVPNNASSRRPLGSLPTGANTHGRRPQTGDNANTTGRTSVAHQRQRHKDQLITLPTGANANNTNGRTAASRPTSPTGANANTNGRTTASRPTLPNGANADTTGRTTLPTGANITTTSRPKTGPSKPLPKTNVRTPPRLPKAPEARVEISFNSSFFRIVGRLQLVFGGGGGDDDDGGE